MGRINIIYPWKMYAEYPDGFEAYVVGNNEEDCMNKIADFAELHNGMPTYYTGVTDECYDCGEYVGERPLYNPE